MNEVHHIQSCYNIVAYMQVELILYSLVDLLYGVAIFNMSHKYQVAISNVVRGVIRASTLTSKLA